MTPKPIGFVKGQKVELGSVIGQTDDPVKIKNIRLTLINDIAEREPYNGYLVYHGVVPEVNGFVRKFRK